MVPALAVGAPPTIDGSDPFSGSNAGATVITKNITTTLPEDVIALGTGTQSGAAPVTVTTVSGCGLTWAKRKSASTTSTCRAGLTNPCSLNGEIWWAEAAAPLAGCTVTVNFSAAMDQGGIGWMGVNGTTTPSAPWDINGSLPYSNTGLSSVPNFAGISTSALSYRLISYALVGRNTLEQFPCLGAPVWASGSPQFLDQRHGASLALTGASLAVNGRVNSVSSNYYSNSSTNCPAGESTAAGDNWIVITDALIGPFTAPGGTRGHTWIME